MQPETLTAPAGNWKGWLNHLIAYRANSYFVKQKAEPSCFGENQEEVSIGVILQRIYTEVDSLCQRQRRTALTHHQLSVANAW